MVRGRSGVERPRTVSTRVSLEEWSAWDAVRAQSGRAEMGAWVREVVTAHVAGRAAPGPRSEEAEELAQLRVELVAVANNLNQGVRALNTAGIDDVVLDRLDRASSEVAGMIDWISAYLRSTP